jgi:hypothetical protein
MCVGTAVLTAAILVGAYLGLVVYAGLNEAGPLAAGELGGLELQYRSYWLTFLGTLCGQVFSVPGCYGNSIPFIRRMVPGQSGLYYRRVDFWVSILLGPLLAYWLVTPETPYVSLGAGLGWNYVLKGAVIAIARFSNGGAANPVLVPTSDPGGTP